MMEKMKIIEGNKLIESFMGNNPFGAYHEDDDLYLNLDDKHRHLKQGSFTKYHLSWDSLMPVIEKIEGLICDLPFKGIVTPYQVELLSRNQTNIFNWPENTSIVFINKDNISKIESAWMAVVEFINWYNVNRKSIS